MERSEYRKRTAENRARVALGGVGVIGGLDATGPYYLDAVQDAVISAPWHGGVSLAVLAAGGIVTTCVTRHRRGTDEYQYKKRLQNSAWAGRRTRREHVGLPAARREARSARPDMTRAQRLRAPAQDVGIPLGRSITGPSSARGHLLVLPWEQGGGLILGEPGTRKSTLLKGIIVGLPGPAVVVSTKTELATETGMARRRSDGSAPVYAFNPLSWDDTDLPPLRWSLVRGCADPRVAQRRARALMEATAAAGLASSDFWNSKGRHAMVALLTAADLAGVGLRQLAGWLQRNDYGEPAKILDRNSDRVEQSMQDTLRMLNRPDDKTATSVSHTASGVLEFLTDGTIADALDPPQGTAVDLEDIVRQDGTIYLVTDNTPSLAPVMSALWDSIIAAAKTVAAEGSAKRLPRPLALVADEVTKTLPSVPLDQHADELRSHGIYILAAAQNRSQLFSTWGEREARGLLSSLRTHVLLGLNDQDDREYYQRRIGSRSVEHVKTSHSQPSTHRKRMVGGMSRQGHSESHSTDSETEPLWSAESWSWLRAGHAVVVPSKGSAAIVDTGNGAKTAQLACAAVEDALERAARRAEAPEPTPAAEPTSEYTGGAV